MEAAVAAPLYAQIAKRLRGQIQAGVYAPGSKIPSEHELSARFQVGRPTVRQATQLLVEERVLERRRGSGTYVSGAPREVDLFSAGGTLASFTRSGLAIESTVAGRARLVASPAGIEVFAARSAFFVERTSSVDGEPVLLEHMYFDAEVFGGLDQLDLTGRSLSELARAHYLVDPVAAEQRFGVAKLDSARAERLGLTAGDTVLKVERTLDFRTAVAAVFAELYCRSDRIQFSQRLAFGRSGSVDLQPEAGARAARST